MQPRGTPPNDERIYTVFVDQVYKVGQNVELIGNEHTNECISLVNYESSGTKLLTTLDFNTYEMIMHFFLKWNYCEILFNKLPKESKTMC